MIRNLRTHMGNLTGDTLVSGALRLARVLCAAALTGAIASAAAAEISGISYTASGFPEGTECKVGNVPGPVTIKQRKKGGKISFTIKIKEGAAKAEISCTTPSGKVVKLNGHKTFPQGAQGMASVTEAYSVE